MVRYLVPNTMDREAHAPNPEYARAVDAALRGGPVRERAFKIGLPDIQGWPEPEMVVVPSGAFRMGDEDRREVRIVYPFALGKFAVTFAEWDAARANGAQLAKLSDQGWGRDRRPVINASWRDARAYLVWLNAALGLGGCPGAYRLPSEAEWEYACRAGRATAFSTGVNISTNQAQFAAFKTAPVGSFPANAFGLYDMHGNVWEWCQDVWHDDLAGAPRNGAAWDGAEVFCERVLRGGAWHGVPEGLRCAARNGDVEAARRPWFGFRIARTAMPV